MVDLRDLLEKSTLSEMFGKKIDDLEITVNGCRKKIIDNGTEKNKLSELEDAKNSLLEVEKQRNNLQQKIVSLTALLDEQKQNYAEKEMQTIKDEETISEHRKEIEQLKKNVSKLETSLNEASTIESVLKQNLKEAKAKESILMQKISEGSGVENLAMEQMHKEKMALEETVNGLNETLKSLNTSHENAISQHEESWKKSIEAEKEKVKKLENELSNLHCNYISAEEKNKKLSALLEERTTTSEEKNKIIETERIKLKSAVEKLTLMEEKVLQLDNELREKGIAAIRRNEECMKLKETMREVQSELKEIKIAKKK
ncbi:hypothetical protein WUBG_12365, partial [Wuchereria bancrofti]